jgi:hypothetical protein
MMKRFGRYDNDFSNLFECYNQVTGVVSEKQLPSQTRNINLSSKDRSFPGLERIKVFVQKHGRGADLMHMINVTSVGSDDGDGGTILTGQENDKTFHMSTTKDNAHLKIVDAQGNVENDFVTNVKPRYDTSTNELTIIHVENL